jgi:phytoene synthase
MRFEIARCRELYVSADLGLAMLPTESAKCIGAARVLYGRILDKIEEQHYDVFAKRARVSTAEKALMVAKLTSPFGR